LLEGSAFDMVITRAVGANKEKVKAVKATKAQQTQ